MGRSGAVALGLCGLLLASCSLNSTDDPVEERSREIVRGKLEKKRPQVVAMHDLLFDLRREICTGTYIAPRIVLTAAHCILNNVFPGQKFVYYGDDFLTDRESLPIVPPPGEPSVWAHVETFMVHPDYDRALNYPDMAILFLDRELPFEPLPILTSPLPDSENKGEIVGWGGSKALVADISVVEGAGIKRSAKVKLLGTPTEADFHPDDPNPGILVPEIRANLFKTDGEAPAANTCAGDSGGPLIVKDRGKEYVAGVGFWTGLFCEDYAMFTRIDPFLAFFRDAAQKAGRSPIVPRFECTEPRPDGSLRAHFGYQNDNALTVNVPHGPRNLFPRDTAGARPSDFEPGDNPFDFFVPVASDDRLRWLLTPPAGPVTLLNVDTSAPVCDPDGTQLVCSYFCHASLAAACADGTAPYSQCMSDCALNADEFTAGGCGNEWNAVLRCVAAVPPDAANWDCAFPGFPPFPAFPTCDAEVNTAFACLFGGF